MACVWKACIKRFNLLVFKDSFTINAAPSPSAEENDTITPDYADVASPAPTSPSSNARWIKGIVALLVGIGVGLGAVAWWKKTDPTQPTLHIPSAIPTVPASPPVQAVAAIQSWLLLGEREHLLGQGQIALPSGSRFQIRVQSAHAGQLSIRAINAQGMVSASPLWQGTVTAGQTIATNTLRVEGVKGQETVLIELLPSNGGPVLTQTAYLWHL